MPQFLAPIINGQQLDDNGDPLTGGFVEVYLAGSSTPASTTSDQAGAVPNSWPIVLNTLGVNEQGAVWLTGGAAYKFVVKNASGVVQRSGTQLDNIRGINDTTLSVDQWIAYQAAPTYVSASSFSVPGDQTGTFQPKRRVKTQNTAGFAYGTIISSAYVAPNTTVTLSNTSGVLDAGLSQVSYGLISVQDSSVSGLLLNVRRFTANTTYTPTAGTNSVKVTAVGGGGSGGGAFATSGTSWSTASGGASGSMGVARFTSGFSGVAIVIGAGGVSPLGAAGGPGGTTTFGGTLLIAPGGGGGGTATATTTDNAIAGQGDPGASPTTTGTLIIANRGQPGPCGLIFASFSPISGQGAPSPLGGGGGANTAAGLGGDGMAPGAGGGGSANNISTGDTNGGVGGAGIVIIEEYT